MPELMMDGLFARMVMKHRDDVVVIVFTRRDWGRLFDTRGLLFWELILVFLSTLRFEEVLLELDTPDTIQFQLGGARRCMRWSQFILALGLHTEVEMESFGFARYWRTDNQEKDEKQRQNDKTGLGMEKTVKDKAKSKPESQSSQQKSQLVKVKVNPEAKRQRNISLGTEI
ncbi:hypothetical protein Tco_0030199, partial [Tanacetum coccineum]